MKKNATSGRGAGLTEWAEIDINNSICQVYDFPTALLFAYDVSNYIEVDCIRTWKSWMKAETIRVGAKLNNNTNPAE